MIRTAYEVILNKEFEKYGIGKIFHSEEEAKEYEEKLEKFNKYYDDYHAYFMNESETNLDCIFMTIGEYLGSTDNLYDFPIFDNCKFIQIKDEEDLKHFAELYEICNFDKNLKSGKLYSATYEYDEGEEIYVVIDKIFDDDLVALKETFEAYNVKELPFTRIMSLRKALELKYFLDEYYNRKVIDEVHKKFKVREYYGKTKNQ